MNSTALSFGTPDHLINLSSNQHQAVLTHWIWKRYRKLMSNSIRRRPLPGSREVHLNLSQRVGARATVAPAKGLMCPRVQCRSRRTTCRLIAATMPVVCGRDTYARIAVDVNHCVEGPDVSGAGLTLPESTGSTNLHGQHLLPRFRRLARRSA